MARVYMESKKTGKQYAVVKFDKEAGTITLKGEHAEFTEPFDKARFDRMGYELKQEA